MLIPALAANTWYVLKLVVDDVRGMTVEVYPESNPSQRATYNIGIITGVSWRFQAWTLSNSFYLDDYKEFSAGAVFSPDERQTFTYDALDRLTGASKVFTEGYTATYTYNPIGNLLSKSENGPTLNYAYTDAAHKHAVTHLNNVQNYWYDANGNMTKRMEGGTTYTQTFDAENRLITVTTPSGTTTFVYDGDGNRVKKVDASSGVTTIYVGALFEKNLTTSVTTSYYLANGQPVALRQNTTVSYLHGDHLGSTSLTTDSTGNVVSRQMYLPYGKVRYVTGTLPTDKGFTGQRLDGTGLMFYNARYYDKTIGRFISADTVVPPGGPQVLNRYSYVLNNPLRHIDPSGHVSTNPCDYYPGACSGPPGPSFEDLFGISFSENMSLSDQATIESAVMAVGAALAASTTQRDTPARAFRDVYGSMQFDLYESACAEACWAWAFSAHRTIFYRYYFDQNGNKATTTISARLVAHELGHNFNANIGGQSYRALNKPTEISTITNAVGDHVTGYNPAVGVFERTDKGYRPTVTGFPWQQHPLTLNGGNSPGEDFADMYLNWVYNTFDYTEAAKGAGTARYNWMTINMAEWVN